MKPPLRILIGRTVAAAAALLPLAATAGTITMSATYYTIAENDQDMNHLAGGVFANEVQNTLGPDGLPLLNTATYGCTSGCFTNTPLPADLTSSGEITWWSASLNKGGTGGVSDVTRRHWDTTNVALQQLKSLPTQRNRFKRFEWVSGSAIYDYVERSIG